VVFVAGSGLAGTGAVTKAAPMLRKVAFYCPECAKREFGARQAIPTRLLAKPEKTAQQVAISSVVET
jgi:hypothetical protein